MTLDKQKVTYASKNGLPVVIKTHTLPPQTEKDLEEVLIIFLTELGQEGLKDHLSYCLRELTVNAKKANTKRVYFKEKGLDLNNPAQYDVGLKTFKKDTLENIEHYLRLQEQEDLYIKVAFLIRNNTLYISVRNNVPITPKELTRVYDRIARSRAFDSMEEAFSEVLDDSEGAGLGIVIMILMLRKMGLSEKAFNLSCVNDETISSITVPMNAVKFERINIIAEEIVKVIDSLPPFPDNLQKLIELLADPDVGLESISRQLSKDPALTADLIRYVNSAKYGTRKKIESITDAVRLIGVQGIKELIYPYGAHKLLSKFLDKQKVLWQEAVRVSSYASDLGKKLKFSKDQQNQVQIGGILYNMGQIILSFLHPDMMTRVGEFCKTKGIPPELFESLASNISPTEIGSKIAEKWNFPEELVQMLKYRHQPQLASPEFQSTICLVNLAENLVTIEKDLISYGQINMNVLKALKLDNLTNLIAVHKELQQSFNREE